MEMSRPVYLGTYLLDPAMMMDHIMSSVRRPLLYYWRLYSVQYSIHSH